MGVECECPRKSSGREISRVERGGGAAQEWGISNARVGDK